MVFLVFFGFLDGFAMGLQPMLRFFWFFFVFSMVLLRHGKQVSQCPELGAQGHTGCSIDLGQKAAQGLHQGRVSVVNSNQNVHILLNSFIFLTIFHVFADRGNR